MTIVVPTLFGLEGLVADELRFFGMEQVRAENGRVLFEGDLEEAARANIRLRMGERVLLELSRFTAVTFEELFQGVRDIPWEYWVGRTDTFPVKGWSLNSTLHSVPDCQSIIKKAIVDRLSSHYGIEWFEETGPTVQIQFSIMKDEVSIMLDTSGPGLHKRGYRANANEAPLRETLAAGMVDLAHVRRDSTVLDPMCGSGTILIEAALKARNISPGLTRRFACEKWSCFPEEIFPREREAARALIRKPEGFQAIGYDIDTNAVELTESNARKAHVEDLIKVRKLDLHRLILPRTPLILITNPPYGERMLDRQEAEELYQVLGSRCHPQPDHSYYVITSDEKFEEYFGRPADRRRKLYNGMLKCNLYMYYKNSNSGGKNNESTIGKRNPR
ncbi:MAG: class I SAM-dependent RNA methyltransferase [Firmicutes bacterium]|nr:class I SAM-dependent RNA methyltransferase [Bacillota bacterium]